jgi:hypothetical protein
MAGDGRGHVGGVAVWPALGVRAVGLIVGFTGLDELRALWTQETAKRDDADAQIAQLDQELRVHREQQAAERADIEAHITRLDDELVAHLDQQATQRAEATSQSADAAVALA